MEQAIAVNAEAEQATVADEALSPKPQKRRINRAKLQDNIWGWAFCVPLIIGTVFFVYVCLVMSLLLSFTNYSLIQEGGMFQAVGDFANRIHQDGWYHWYEYAFTNMVDTAAYPKNELLIYLFNTVFYMIGIPIGMVLAVFFAVCMSRDIKGGNVFRVLYYFPCVASTVSIVFTFKLMFNTSGVMNKVLGLDSFQWLNTTGGASLTWNGLTGSGSQSAFMNDPYWCQGIFSKLVIIIMSVWKGLGGTVILYIAGLSGVNAATKEAAQIDGASGWKIFWKITMPDLYPTIFYNIVTAVIGGMQIYMEPTLLLGESWLTSGYVSLIYVNGIEKNPALPSQGAAYGMILAVMIFILTMFQFWLDSRNKD